MALMVEMFEMKIIDLCVERYRVQRRPHRWRSGLRVSPGGEGIEQLLRVRTDAGIDGLCWIGAEPTHAQLIERGGCR